MKITFNGESPCINFVTVDEFVDFCIGLAFLLELGDDD